MMVELILSSADVALGMQGLLVAMFLNGQS